MIWRPESASAFKKGYYTWGQNIFLMDSKFSGFSPRCAYSSDFKRFSKNGQKVNEMAKTEATVTSGVKNWYIIIFLGVPEVP